MNNNKRLFYILFFSCIHIALAQKNQAISIDSLEHKTISELKTIAASNGNIRVTKVLIDRSKKEKNIEALADGYYLMSIFTFNEDVLRYSDSIIALKDAFRNTLYPASAYYKKGYYLYVKRDFQKATDNFLLANKYAHDYPNPDLLLKSKHGLGLVKEQLLDFEGALEIFRQNLIYARNTDTPLINDDSYLYTISAIATSYNRLTQQDSAIHYTTYGIKESLRLHKESEYYGFVLSAAQTYFLNKEYKRSLDSLHKIKPFYISSNDPTSLASVYYYLARNYQETNKEELAIPLLKNIDTLFQNNRDTRTEIRESYQLLIDYYENKNDLQSQLLYTEKLLALDSLRYKNGLYLNKKILEEYEIPLLIESKQSIIDALEHKKGNFLLIIYVLSGICILVILIVIYLRRKNNLFKKRFEQLINQESVNSSIKETQVNKKSTTLNIPEDIVHHILNRLDTFEKDHKYLDTQISINNLSKTLGTNPNYLSKVINHVKEMSFTQYINNLRIEQAIKTLKNDPLYQKFTIKAIAREFGFKTSESFSKAFYKKTGIKPSFFLKSIESINN